MKMEWRGVIPALTTAFKEDLSVDFEFIRSHCRWLINNGCSGIVALGSLGEAATLMESEKAEVLRACVEAAGARAPVVAGISALSTREAVSLVRIAEGTGCSGLMVLPPYVYLGDWRETKAHVTAVLRATNLSCMLYNNPIAYKVDFVVEQVKELAGENRNLHAIKESSTDNLSKVFDMLRAPTSLVPPSSCAEASSRIPPGTHPRKGPSFRTN